MSEGGKKNDQGKPRISLIPKDAIWSIANGLTYGEKKYGTHNFRSGIKYSRLLDAAYRHLTAWEEGEDVDQESGNNHLDHAGASLAMLMFMASNRPDMDDRWKKEPKPESGTDLYNAGEEAQETVKQMVEINKKEIFNKPKSVSHVEWEISGLEKPKTKFSPGDVVKHVNNDVEVTVEGTYYDEKGKPMLFVKDADGKIFGVDPNVYKSIYKEKSS